MPNLPPMYLPSGYCVGFAGTSNYTIVLCSKSLEISRAANSLVSRRTERLSFLLLFLLLFCYSSFFLPALRSFFRFAHAIISSHNVSTTSFFTVFWHPSSFSPLLPLHDLSDLLDRILPPLLISIILLFLTKFGIDKFMIYAYIITLKIMYRVWKKLCDISYSLALSSVRRKGERSRFLRSESFLYSGWFASTGFEIKDQSFHRNQIIEFRVLQNIPGTSIVSMAAFPLLLFKEELSRSAS